MWPLTVTEVVGACCVEPAAGMDLGIPVTGACTDSRKVAPGDLFVAIKGGRFDGHDFVSAALNSGAVAALVASDWPGLESLSPGDRARCIRSQDTVDSFRNLASFMRRRLPSPVVAVGGSNGKTTTKEMLTALLGGPGWRVTKTDKSENGFLGIAMTLCRHEHALAHAPHTLVLEIGIDEPGAMAEHLRVAQPDVALLTAMGPEHLLGLGTWETGIEEELRLFGAETLKMRVWQSADPVLRERLDQMCSGDVLVFFSGDAEDSKVAAARKSGKYATLEWGLAHHDALHSRVSLKWSPVGRREPVWHGEFDIPLPGKHNAGNFALAAATALGMGRTPRELHQGWTTFVPPPMRSRVQHLKDHAILIDDCYNASPASMEAALELLRSPEWSERPKIAVLGDMLELGQESRKWHLGLAGMLESIEKLHLFLFGDAMYDLYVQLQRSSGSGTRGPRMVEHLGGDRNPALLVESFRQLVPNSIILVKGSRGMGLDRVVARLQEVFAGA